MAEHDKGYFDLQSHMDNLGNQPIEEDVGIKLSNRVVEQMSEDFGQHDRVEQIIDGDYVEEVFQMDLDSDPEIFHATLPKLNQVVASSTYALSGSDEQRNREVRILWETHGSHWADLIIQAGGPPIITTWDENAAGEKANVNSVDITGEQAALLQEVMTGINLAIEGERRNEVLQLQDAFDIRDLAEDEGETK